MAEASSEPTRTQLAQLIVMCALDLEQIHVGLEEMKMRGVRREAGIVKYKEAHEHLLTLARAVGVVE